MLIKTQLQSMANPGHKISSRGQQEDCSGDGTNNPSILLLYIKEKARPLICNVFLLHISIILISGSKSLLKELSVLDLTGVEVFYANILPENKLPPKLHTLILRDSKFSLYNDRIQQLILDHREQLTELDLSIMPLCYDLLWKIAKQLKKLEYFNLCGKPLKCSVWQLLQRNVSGSSFRLRSWFLGWLTLDRT